MESLINQLLIYLPFIIYCTTIYLATRFSWFLYKIFIRRRKDLIKRYGRDSWAMVTGATDGIGKGICMELARTGFNIILVSRTESKLKTVSDELKKSNPNIKTHYIPYDFDKQTTEEHYTKTFGNLQEKFDISILVNNVGTEHHNTFDRVRVDCLYTAINLNIIPQVVLTKILFNKMNKRKRSAVISLSSFAGEFPFAMKSLYSATKIFNHYLSKGLKEETSMNSNIDWLSVKPLEVETVLSTTKADGFMVITPKQCADAILNDLGYEEETYTHWAHKIQAFVLMNFLPKILFYAVVKRFWFKWFIKRDEKSE
jgi:17beta-estradiol 17-dehydrogenase / very-long-chain 3-oxoacyl-CoA reductase